MFALAAAANWVSRATENRRLELLTKPTATVALVVAAATIDPADSGQRTWFVAALVLSLLGDVLLLEDRRFVSGLVAFLTAHVAYVVGFAVAGRTGAALALGVLLTVLILAPVSVRLLGAVREAQPAMLSPVAAYMVVIAAMVASAIASGNAWAIGGALLFATSDSMIAWRRFVAPFPHVGVAIMVTYHLGQCGLVLALI